MLSRRDLLSATGVAALQSSLLASRRQPNFIVFLTDDQGCHDLGCLSNDLKTPRLVLRLSGPYTG
jgi:hypothetical protein